MYTYTIKHPGGGGPHLKVAGNFSDWHPVSTDAEGNYTVKQNSRADLVFKFIDGDHWTTVDNYEVEWDNGNDNNVVRAKDLHEAGKGVGGGAATGAGALASTGKGATTNAGANISGATASGAGTAPDGVNLKGAGSSSVAAASSVNSGQAAKDRGHAVGQTSLPQQAKNVISEKVGESKKAMESSGSGSQTNGASSNVTPAIASEIKHSQGAEPKFALKNEGLKPTGGSVPQREELKTEGDASKGFSGAGFGAGASAGSGVSGAGSGGSGAGSRVSGGGSAQSHGGLSGSHHPSEPSGYDLKGSQAATSGFSAGSAKSASQGGSSGFGHSQKSTGSGQSHSGASTHSGAATQTSEPAGYDLKDSEKSTSGFSAGSGPSSGSKSAPHTSNVTPAIASEIKHAQGAEPSSGLKNEGLKPTGGSIPQREELKSEAEGSKGLAGSGSSSKPSGTSRGLEHPSEPAGYDLKDSEKSTSGFTAGSTTSGSQAGSKSASGVADSHSKTSALGSHSSHKQATFDAPEAVIPTKDAVVTPSEIKTKPQESVAAANETNPFPAEVKKAHQEPITATKEIGAGSGATSGASKASSGIGSAASTGQGRSTDLSSSVSSDSTLSKASTASYGVPQPPNRRANHDSTGSAGPSGTSGSPSSSGPVPEPSSDLLTPADIKNPDTATPSISKTTQSRTEVPGSSIAGSAAAGAAGVAAVGAAAIGTAVSAAKGSTGSSHGQTGSSGSSSDPVSSHNHTGTKSGPSGLSGGSSNHSAEPSSARNLSSAPSGTYDSSQTQHGLSGSELSGSGASNTIETATKSPSGSSVPSSARNLSSVPDGSSATATGSGLSQPSATATGASAGSTNLAKEAPKDEATLLNPVVVPDVDNQGTKDGVPGSFDNDKPGSVQEVARPWMFLGLTVIPLVALVGWYGLF
ncbi:hypothetical protein DICA0_A01816 [Diutina catenulata]